ncbi:MAG: TerB family tellurite resistance protein [Gammaproteobacteria bacterium]|nr:TerB family tellurite resistance protein [Gammaproteobacteria bacterium]
MLYAMVSSRRGAAAIRNITRKHTTTMIGAIHGLLKKHLAPETAVQADNGQALQLATAALLMEVAGADDHIGDDERRVIRRIVTDAFGLSDEQTATILREAEKRANDLTCLYPFTKLLNRECSLKERIEIVRQLWEVAFVDGRVDAHEEHLVRRVADLLYVPHSYFIRGKLHHAAGTE